MDLLQWERLNGRLDNIEIAISNISLSLGVKIMALEDDLEAATNSITSLLMTLHDELTAALAQPVVDRARVQAVVDKINAAVAANPNPETPPPPAP
jgi:hypothetical protein